MIWFYYVENGNHDWPGPFSYPSAAGRNQDIDMNNEIYEFITDKITSVKVLNSDLPDGFALTQNYPNPFNPLTTIRYAIPHSAKVKLAVHDMLGRKIETLVDEEQSAGWKEVQWNAQNISSGVYFYKLSAGNYLQTRKMLVVK